MIYAVLFAVTVLATIVITYAFKLKAGQRFLEALITGSFNDSPVDKIYANWFADDMDRVEQRDLFVKICLGIGCRRGMVGDSLRRAIAKAWSSVPFGVALSGELDRLIVFDPVGIPSDAQQRAQAAFASVKASLRELDK